MGPRCGGDALGHLAFFAHYLKVSGRFDALMADCPLAYTSPNAPKPRDVVGTAMLAILAGQWRLRAHDGAARRHRQPAALGHDPGGERGCGAARPGPGPGAGGCHLALRSSGRQGSRPILTEPWILDADTTIKPLYEGAEVGYNPHKPGRP